MKKTIRRKEKIFKTRKSYVRDSEREDKNAERKRCHTGGIKSLCGVIEKSDKFCLSPDG